MTPIDWLSAKAPGFTALSEAERNSIMHFSLMWSYFEAQALHTNASSTNIHGLVQNWASTGRLKLTPFATSVAYFQSRYFNQGEFTDHFTGLHLRNNDRKDMVKAMLGGASENDADTVSALLIVVFRLRNNLFHGIKWADGISGQFDNFTYASTALMAALDTNSLPPNL